MLSLPSRPAVKMRYPVAFSTSTHILPQSNCVQPLAFRTVLPALPRVTTPPNKIISLSKLSPSSSQSQDSAHPSKGKQSLPPTITTTTTSFPTSSPTSSPASSPTSSSKSSSKSSSTPSLQVSLGLLNLTTVLWGTQHAVIKLALSDTNPSTLNFARFALAALISAPALRPLLRSPKPWRNPVFRHGVELSFYLFAGYALQSAALLTTSASRSAFLLYLNVKLVPLFARVFYNRRIAPATWGSAAMALAGTALLTYDGAPPALGDGFSIAAAAASALFILRTEAASRDPDVTPSALNSVTLVSVAALTGSWTAFAAFLHSGMDFAAMAKSFLPSTPHAAAAVTYLAVVTTALCNYLQAIGQKGVSAERAAVVFAMDPVYGALFAWLLLGESFGRQGIAGAIVILAAALVSGFADSNTHKRQGKGNKLSNAKVEQPDDNFKSTRSVSKVSIPPNDEHTRGNNAATDIMTHIERQVLVANKTRRATNNGEEFDPDNNTLEENANNHS